MAEIALAARSALAGMLRAGHHGRPGSSGVVIEERTGLGLVTVAAHRGKGAALAKAVRDAFGLDLPMTPRRVGDAALAFVWAGKERWLAVSETGSEPLETTLRDHLGGLASVTDQSDGRVVLRCSGPSVRDVLGKALSIDFHPRAFRPDDVAITPAFHIATQVWQVDDQPTYDLSVGRSTAGSLSVWMVQAAEEYGVDVVGRAAPPS